MPKSERLINLATIVLTVCAVATTGILVRQQFAHPRTNPLSSMAPVDQPDWQRYAQDGHVLGSPAAAITIVEFSDFECPYCRRFKIYLDSLRTLGKEIRVVYRHFPLHIHRFAARAALVSECAATQGKFEAIHDKLFEYADSLGLVPWQWFAEQAEVADIPRFNQCVQAGAPVVAIRRDTLDGKALGITSTPTLLIGRIRLNGVPPFDSLRAYVDRATKGIVADR